jgi:hypothetical protein
MPATLELKIGGRSFTGAAIPEAFLAHGTKGVRAFAWDVGSAEAADQVSKGNEISGIFVDGYKGRAPDQMKRNIVWEFTIGNSQLVKAAREALDLARKYSLGFARESKGNMANSWAIYIDGKPATPDALANVTPGKEDVRITTHMAYARFLEAGYWAAGTPKVLKRELKRGIKQVSQGKAFRRNISVTDQVVRDLKNKYKAINISDVWYETAPNGIKTAAPNARWPAIVLNRRKRTL